MTRPGVFAAAAALLVSGGAWGQPVPLGGPDEVRALCRALRPVERVRFDGDPEARERQQRDFVRERERLASQDRSIELDWSGFVVARWSREDGTVTLDAERPFRAMNGALALFDLDRDQIRLQAVEGAEDALARGLARGSLTLALAFRPAEAEATPCTISRTDSFAFAVDLLSAELREGDRVLARAQEDGFEPMVTAGGAPRVEIRASNPPDCADCAEEVLAGIVGRGEAITACYRQALERSPSLDGTLVLAVETAEGGRLAVRTVVADAIQDEVVLGCIRKAIAEGRSPKKGRASVVIDLEREPVKPAEAAEAADSKQEPPAEAAATEPAAMVQPAAATPDAPRPETPRPVIE
jgi:hypothetical protein